MAVENRQLVKGYQPDPTYAPATDAIDMAELIGDGHGKEIWLIQTPNDFSLDAELKWRVNQQRQEGLEATTSSDGASFVLEAENNSARHIFVPPASADGKARPVTRIMTIRKVSTADREYCAASEDPVQLPKKKKRKEDGGEPTPASQKKAAKSDAVEAGQDETKKDKKHKKKKKAKEAAQVA
ncbi:hypothetical protein ACKKBF_B31470 [Auxenochlorella protothecoides x Auxenochlorella symbiontica]